MLKAFSQTFAALALGLSGATALGQFTDAVVSICTTMMQQSAQQAQFNSQLLEVPNELNGAVAIATMTRRQFRGRRLGLGFHCRRSNGWRMFGHA